MARRVGNLRRLYATDRRTFVVQGWKVGDPKALADLVDVHDEEVFVEIPKGLLRCDDGDPGEAVSSNRPGRPAIYATPRDTYLVRGWEDVSAGQQCLFLVLQAIIKQSAGVQQILNHMLSLQRKLNTGSHPGLFIRRLKVAVDEQAEYLIRTFGK